MGRRTSEFGLPMAIIALIACACAFASLAAAGEKAPSRTSDHLVIVPTTGAGEVALAATSARTVAALRRVHAGRGDRATTSHARARRRRRARRHARGARSAPAASDPTRRPAVAAAQDGRSAAHRRQGRERARGRPVRRAAEGRLDRRGAQDRRRGRLLHGAERRSSWRRRRPRSRGSPSCSRSRRFIRAVTPYTAADKTLPGLAARRHAPRSSISTVAGDAAATRARGRRARSRRRAATPSPSAGIIQHRVALDAAELDGARRARRRGRDRAVRRAEAARRARGDDRRRPLTASFQPVLGTGYRQFLADNGFATELGDRRSTSPTRASTRASCRCPRARIRTSTALGDPPTRAASSTPRRRPQPTPTRATAAATAPTSPRSPPATTRSTGAAYEDAQGFNYGLGVAPVRASSARPRSSTAPAASTSRRRSRRCTARPTRAAPASPTTPGARPSAAPTTPTVAGVRRARARRAARRGGQPGVHRGRLGRQLRRGRRTRSARPGTAKNVITVGASESVRADRRHRRLRRDRRRRQQRPRHHRLLQPRADRRRAHQARHRRARARMSPARSRRPGPTTTAAAPAIRSSRRAARSTRSCPAPRRPRPEVDRLRRADPRVVPRRTRRRRGSEPGDDQGADGQHRHRPGRRRQRRRRRQRERPDADPGLGPHQPRQRARRHQRAGASTRRQRVRRRPATARAATTTSPRAAKPLRVTLAWTDAAGPDDGQQLRQRPRPGGHGRRQDLQRQRVRPAASSVTGGAADPRNNVENVFLPAGITGPDQGPRRSPANIAGDGVPGNADTTDQDFALVVSNVGAAARHAAPCCSRRARARSRRAATATRTSSRARPSRSSQKLQERRQRDGHRGHRDADVRRRRDADAGQLDLGRPSRPQPWWPTGRPSRAR